MNKIKNIPDIIKTLNDITVDGTTESWDDKNFKYILEKRKKLGASLPIPYVTVLSYETVKENHKKHLTCNNYCACYLRGVSVAKEKIKELQKEIDEIYSVPNFNEVKD